ncbi:hypothetical protein TNCV_3934631 [Trichonephila clavipes]|nr:hypothetical protein TNCV_3934631 [Trichonephila clavipes]
MTVHCTQWHPIPSHQLCEWLSLKNKDRIEAFTLAPPQMNTIAITAEIESGFVAYNDLIPFRFSPVSSCVASLQTKASMSGRQGQHT